MRQSIIMKSLLVTAYMIVVIGIAVGVAACGQDEGPFSPSGQETALDDATVTIDGITFVKWTNAEGLVLSDDDSDDDSDSSDDESSDSDDDSDDGSNDSDEGSDDSDDDSSDDDGYSTCYDECEVDSSGKRIKTSGASLTVPRGAINSAVRISMRRDDDSDDGVWSYRTAFEFGPAGLQFEQPATLTIEIAPHQLQSMGLDPERLRIAYVQGDDHDDWELLGGRYDPDTGSIAIEVWHFSRYALCIE